MRFYTVLDFQYWALAFFLGLTALAFVCVAWGSYPRQRTREAEEKLAGMADDEIATAHDVEKNPIAPFLILVYAFTVLWAIGYMIFIGIRGTSI
jgi:hypothetical protein